MESSRKHLFFSWLPIIALMLVFLLNMAFRLYDISSVCEIINPPNGKEYVCGNGYASNYIASVWWFSLFVFAYSMIKSFILKLKLSKSVMVGYTLSSVLCILSFLGGLYFWLQNFDYP